MQIADTAQVLNDRNILSNDVQIFKILVPLAHQPVRGGWKEIKQQPCMLPGPAVPGCSLISFHFLWAIHPIRPVRDGGLDTP